MSATITETVQLCFGLKSTDKYPKATLVSDVESTVTRIARQGTYAGGSDKVFDTYERIVGITQMRAFIDLDVKKYVDGTDIPKYEGIIIREQFRDAFVSIIPILEEEYGTVVLGDSSGMKTPPGEYIVSFRLWFPQVIGSKHAIKIFAETIVSNNIMPHTSSIGGGKINWDKFFDTSVYSGIVKLRLPGCTKQGEKHRPLIIDSELSSDGVDFTDTLVTYNNSKYTVHVLEEPELKSVVPTVSKPPKHIEFSTVVPTPRILTDYQFNLLCSVADACPVSDWDKHDTRFLFISALWNMEQTERMKTFIHSQCEAKNAKNDQKVIEREIYNSIKYPVSPNVLLKHVWNYDRAAVVALKTKFLYFWDTLFKREEEERSINEVLRTDLSIRAWKHETYSERYVRPYPLDIYDTIIVRSHMGTGKTACLVGSKTLSMPCMITRERFERVLILSSRRTYASFILGELHTEGLKYYQNYMDLKGELSASNHLVLQMESLHRIAESYIPYDLVIMDESESLLAQMNSVGTHTVNHRVNYEMLERVVHDARKIIAMDAFIASRTLDFLEALRCRERGIYIHNTYQPYARKATEHVVLTDSQIHPHVAALHERLINSAVAGKRIVYVCSSKEKGYEMEKMLEEKCVDVIYHCGDDTREKKDLLLNVREEWAKHQVVIYTSTITVGVSYSNISPEHEFDELYLYASASCALPRDIAQALLRARVIKSNQLWFCIERRCVVPAVFGLKNVSEQVAARRTNPAIKDLKWSDTPKWVLQLISNNENEIAVSKRFYVNMLRSYLQDSGYIITDPVDVRKVSSKAIQTAGKPAFADIVMLDDLAAAVIEKRIGEELATVDERIQFTKWRFIHLFIDGVELEYMERIWNAFFCAPEGKKTCMEAQFWNIVHERQRDIGRAWKAETRVRYAEQARGSLLQQTTVGKLCDLLGIENTCVEKTWINAEFNALVPALLGMETEVRNVLILRNSQGDQKDTEFNRAADFLRCALGSWSGTQLFKINETRKQINRVRVRQYDIQIKPVISNIFTILKIEKDIRAHLE